MELLLQRSENNGNATIGRLYINQVYECFTLEDEPREVKVMGETRIPAGRYEIKLRTIGRLHEAYSKKFPDFHKGMLEITGIPTHTAVCIHIGNTEKDTAGCPLVGKSQKNFTLQESTAAYIPMYKKVIKALETERVFITIKDENNG